MPAPTINGGDREKSLATALAQIDKQYGKGSVMRLGDEARAPIDVIPTGSIALDVALGIGGLPRGVGSSRVDLQACKLEYSIVSPK